MVDKLLCSVVRGAIPLSIGAPRTDFRSGCSTIEVTFPNHNTSTNSGNNNNNMSNATNGMDGAADVGEIHFKNYYVAFLTVRVRLKGAADDEDVWRTLVKNKRLMEDPHSERGSHDLIILGRRDIWGSGSGLLTSSCLSSTNVPNGVVPMAENVVALRFILRQPSPVWKDFYLDDIKIYAPPPSEPHHTMLTLPEFLKREENAQRRPDKSKMANIVLPNVGAVSMELQQLWGLTELLKANQPTVGVGRYDVDGSYDINLLSYA